MSDVKQKKSMPKGLKITLIVVAVVIVLGTLMASSEEVQSVSASLSTCDEYYAILHESYGNDMPSVVYKYADGNIMIGFDDGSYLNFVDEDVKIILPAEGKRLRRDVLPQIESVSILSFSNGLSCYIM